MDAAEATDFFYQHIARERHFSASFVEYLYRIKDCIAVTNELELNEQRARFVLGCCGNVYELWARLYREDYEPMTSWYDFPNWLEAQGVHYR